MVGKLTVVYSNPSIIRMNLSLGDNLHDSESQFLSAYTRKVVKIRKNNTTSKLSIHKAFRARFNIPNTSAHSRFENFSEGFGNQKSHTKLEPNKILSLLIEYQMLPPYTAEFLCHNISLLRITLINLSSFIIYHRISFSWVRK